MLRELHRGVAIIEIVIFALTTGALSYYGNLHAWTTFWAVLILSLLLYSLLQVQKWRPYDTYLRRRERQEFKFVTRLSEYGIVDIFNMQSRAEQFERNELTRSLIRQSRVFALCSLSAASYVDPAVHRHWDDLRRKLESGAPFRLLIQDPLGPEKRVRDQLNSTALGGDSKLSIERLIVLYESYQNVAVRFSRGNIYAALFFADDNLIYDPYHLGKVEDRIENYFLAMHIKDGKTATAEPDGGHSYFQILKAHFEVLWNSGVELEAYVLENASVLANGDALAARLMTVRRTAAR
jgi:hypothetical protein